MIHEMNLNNGPYEKIDIGTKTVELRLYDEKRQLLKVSDHMNENKVNINCLITIYLRTSTNPYFMSDYKNYDNAYFI